MKVKDMMNSNVISITPDTSISAAARMLSRYNIGSMPVCSIDGRLRGIVTDRDIVLRCIAAEVPPEQTKVRDIMTRAVVTVSPESDMREAAALMAKDQVRRLPVVEHGTVVGMLALGDIARSHSFDTEASAALSEISSNIRNL